LTRKEYEMSELIEALQIFLSYDNVQNPTHCEHDILLVVGIDEKQPSAQHQKRLDELGFFWSEEYDCWASFRFGSA
jgi:hypothetical protein